MRWLLFTALIALILAGLVQAATSAERHKGCTRRYVRCSEGGHMLLYRHHGPEFWYARFRSARAKLRAHRHASAATAGWSSAVASYYGTDGTSGGCGMSNGPSTFASLIVPCGARVEFCRAGACVTGTRTDSGPYIAGRSFDLSSEMASALGFTSAGVASVQWRRVG